MTCGIDTTGAIDFTPAIQPVSGDANMAVLEATERNLPAFFWYRIKFHLSCKHQTQNRFFHLTEPVDDLGFKR